jgi:uncharacterized protein YdhG (YjbR/CyaY superfamily)
MRAATFRTIAMKRMQAAAASIDQYLEGFPEDVRKKLQQIRATIQKAAPDAVEAIKYHIPTFVLNGNLVHFGAYKTHIGFYPGASGIKKFKKELGPYNISKGTLQLPLDRPLPLALLRKIVLFRVGENRAKVAAAKRKKRSAQK